MAEHGKALGPEGDYFLPLPQVFVDQSQPERGKDKLTVVDSASVLVCNPW